MGKKKAAGDSPPLKLFYIFYSRDRWNNWLATLQDMSFESPEGSDEVPEGLAHLYRFAEDITIEVLKIVRLFQNKRFTKEEALEKLREVEFIIMCECPDGKLGEVIENLQLSLLVLFAGCRRYVNGDFDKDVKALVKKGRECGDEDMDGALAAAGSIAAAVIGGAPCCAKYLKDDVETTTLFDDWLVEVETMKEAMESLDDFDEPPPGEEE
ncbi:MAG: DUF2150 family protein [Methanomicrobiales archaeon]|nr:DUF2150 family protein [Methanomicrobiales archaeon]